MSDFTTSTMTLPPVNPHGINQNSCDKPGHNHRWKITGELMIERCEHYCLFCTGKDHDRHWKSAWHLRRHVNDTHVKNFPGLSVSPGWTNRPSGNARPLNKKPRAPGSNKKRGGTKEERARRLALAMRQAQHGNPAAYNFITTGHASGIVLRRANTTPATALQPVLNQVTTAPTTGLPVFQDNDSQLIDGLAATGIPAAKQMQSDNMVPVSAPAVNDFNLLIASNNMDLAIGNAIVNGTQQTSPYFAQEMGSNMDMATTVYSNDSFNISFTPVSYSSEELGQTMSPAQYMDSIQSSPAAVDDTPPSYAWRMPDSQVDPTLLGGDQLTDGTGDMFMDTSVNFDFGTGIGYDFDFNALVDEDFN